MFSYESSQGQRFILKQFYRTFTRRADISAIMVDSGGKYFRISLTPRSNLSLSSSQNNEVVMGFTLSNQLDMKIYGSLCSVYKVSRNLHHQHNVGVE